MSGLTNRSPARCLGPASERSSAYGPAEAEPVTSWADSGWKRALDVALGLVGAAILLVSGPMIALLIRLDSDGPTILAQPRCGREGAPFRLLKFRTMYANSSERSARWTAVDDPRITRFGRILRALHLDELPQVLNVLRGEMSIVGPRPEQVAIAHRLRREIDGYGEREAVRPGMVGLACLELGYVDSVDGTRHKLSLDRRYLAEASLRTDLTILGRALLHCLSLRGR